MDRLTSAEGTFKRALSVAEEIATLGEDLVKQLEGHRDDIKSAAGTLLSGIGGVATAIKAEAAVAKVIEPDPHQDGSGDGQKADLAQDGIKEVEEVAGQFLGRG